MRIEISVFSPPLNVVLQLRQAQSTVWKIFNRGSTDEALCHDVRAWCQTPQGALLIQGGAKDWPALDVSIEDLRAMSETWWAR